MEKEKLGMKTTGTNPGRGRLQTRLSEVSRYSWVNIYTYMAARQGESFSSAWEADLGGTPWNAVGVLNGVYRFMTCLKRRARNCPIAIPLSRNFIDIDKWTRPVNCPPLYRLAFFTSVI